MINSIITVEKPLPFEFEGSLKTTYHPKYIII